MRIARALPVLVAWAAGAEAQVTLRLSAPPDTPDTVYVAGNFNNWNPADPAYRMRPLPGGGYVLEVPNARSGTAEFKFTLGSWDRVETDAAGGDVPNRVAAVLAGQPLVVNAQVLGWRDGSPRPRPPSTARPTVSVLSEEFEIPQLGRKRRVWLYLPPDYATTDKRYPVLYMHDGQNLFDQATGFQGEWGVDESLDSLHAMGDWGVIVVAVDHGDQRRLSEYSPWPNDVHGGGEGRAYIDFLVQTLKPYIDRNYRTRADPLSTGIAGSSMGGLLSLYAALEHPEVFGRAGVFSPALWYTPVIFAHARSARPSRDTRLYFVTGAREGNEPEVYVRDQRRMIDTLAAAGFAIATQVDSAIRADGTHTESFWRREFPAAYRWLFAGARAPRQVPTPRQR